MRIKMLTRIEGTRNSVRWPEAGTVIDLPDGEAADLVTSGLAEPVAVVPAERTEKRPAAKRAEKRA
jgi:hypothetical protein